MTAFAVATVTVTATYLFLDPISSLFTHDAETFAAIRKFLVYAMAFVFLDAAGTPVQASCAAIRTSRSLRTSPSSPTGSSVFPWATPALI